MDKNCWIYKCDKREEMYLYVDSADDFSRVPDSLLAVIGNLELVMSLRLHSSRKLARADVEKVISELRHKGFYLQMPPSLGVDGHSKND